MKKLNSAFALSVLSLLCLLCSQAVAQSYVGALTWHYDNARTGLNTQEAALKLQNVNTGTFGKIFAFPVDGQIYGQPLYVLKVNIPGKGTHSVIYVATENDSVYAFDAGGATTTPLWHVNFLDTANGVTTVPCLDNAASCNVYPVIGITSTPVIDAQTGIMYVVAQTKDTGQSQGCTPTAPCYFVKLHALDITTGAEMNGGPVNISGQVPGSGAGSVGGQVPFDPQHSLQRPALALANGYVYIGSEGSEHGWVFAYNKQTLVQTGIFNTTPNSVLGGVWQSGAGIAVDNAGYIYFATGDATFDLNNNGTDYGDTVLKMKLTTNGFGAVNDPHYYFTPMDQSCRVANDMDFAGGGPMLIPQQPGSPVTNEIIMSGKGGWLPNGSCDTFNGVPASPIYVLNRDNLGGYNPAQDAAVQEVAGSGYGYHSSPAYYKGTTGTWIYYGGLVKQGQGDTLKAWSITNGLLSTNFTSQSSATFRTCTTPAVSAHGTTNGIVWTLERTDGFSTTPGNSPAILHAYDATNLATELYNSNQASGSRDQAGSAIKFQTPLIALGRVYVGTQTELDVYGLLAGQTATTTTINSSQNPSNVGDPVTFTATVSATGVKTIPGSVTFKDGTTVIGSANIGAGNAAQITISTLTKGNHTITAFYDGMAKLAVSNASMTQTVN